MKRLVIVGGTMGVGKTTTCKALKRRLAPCAFLDGDWCWDMEPFQVTWETKALVQENIAFMLGQFLSCSAFENVLFCWVLHQWEITEALLQRLPLEGVQVRTFSLMARPETLRAHLEKDVKAGLRTWGVVDRSLARLPLYDALPTEKLWVDGLTPEETAERLWKML